jgi:radical SAM superfamily enzyme YgiQ (UPF0313 family)
MARVLLMCMPDIYQPWHAFHIKGPWLGGASIAGNCPNHEVYVADLVLKRSNVRRGIQEGIERTNPQIIGLSAMTFQYPTAVRIATHIKTAYPGIPVVLGGYHFHRRTVDTAESSRGCDFVCTFCSMRVMISGTKFNPYNHERVLGDLRSIRRMGIESGFFTDDKPALDIENLYRDRIITLAGLIVGNPDDTEEVIRMILSGLEIALLIRSCHSISHPIRERL